jgi:L-fuculose-phosphate aldolase
MQSTVGMSADEIAPGHSKDVRVHRCEICTAGKWLYSRGYAPSSDGNISVRLDEYSILATPRGFCKGKLLPEDLVITNLRGEKLEGRNEPSTELPMHLFVYQQRPDVKAVCHAHPPIATGFAAAGQALDKPLLAEMIITFGEIPLAPFAMPGTPELPASLEPLIQNHDAILMANHGVVTYGVDLLSAFHRMDVVEHFARVTLVTELLGKQSLLSGRVVEKLLATRPPHDI